MWAALGPAMAPGVLSTIDRLGLLSDAFVRHCLCLVLQPPSWLRHCLCLVLQPSSWLGHYLRHLACFVAKTLLVRRRSGRPGMSQSLSRWSSLPPSEGDRMPWPKPLRTTPNRTSARNCRLGTLLVKIDWCNCNCKLVASFGSFEELDEFVVWKELSEQLRGLLALCGRPVILYESCRSVPFCRADSWKIAVVQTGPNRSSRSSKCSWPSFFAGRPSCSAGPLPPARMRTPGRSARRCSSR